MFDFYSGQNTLQTLVFDGLNVGKCKDSLQMIHSKIYIYIYIYFVNHLVSSEDSKSLAYLIASSFNFGEIVSLFSQKGQESDLLNAWMLNVEGFIYM